jgi:alkanesulfonate monooxygenase SsuD/methylene tetrahydromethanopterin reductase-like flavin-dependent oxidoreductase (luciferase family)
MKPMLVHFGYSVFSRAIEEQIELAILADRLGYSAVMAGEHIVLPAGAPSVYQPRASGLDENNPTQSAGLPQSIYDEETRFWDLPGLLASMARETKRISLITAVYLAGLRHPLITASFMATLHELSHGRFQLGLGAGWNKGEYEAVGGHFEARGNILDETVDVLRAAMQGGPFEHHGPTYSFGPVRLTQNPGIVPILFGGHSAPAMRRAARVGDGWISSLYSDVAELKRFVDFIESHRKAMGTFDRPFHYWVKMTCIDTAAIEALQKFGISRFQLIGEKIWGPRDASFQLRAERMKQVAAQLGLDGH